MRPRLTIDHLRRAPLLSELDDVSLRRFGRAMEPRLWLRGQEVFEAGIEHDRMGIVLEGRLSVNATYPDGRVVTVGTIFEGEPVGELQVMYPCRTTASVRASVRSSVCLLAKTRLDALLHDRPELGPRLYAGAIRLVNARLQETELRIDEELARRSVRAWGESVVPEDTQPPDSRTRIDLRRLSCLATFPTAELAELMQAAPVVSRGPGHVLYRDGEVGDCGYVLVHGTADIFRRIGGRSVFFATMHAGALLGQRCVVAPSEMPRVVLRGRSVLMRLDRAKLSELLAASSPFANRLQRQIALAGIAQYRRAQSTLISLLGHDPNWQATPEAARDEVRRPAETAPPLPRKPSGTQMLNTQLLNKVKLAVNEWGLELESFGR